ncbi:MAG: ABC transporter ATP-binding protein [Paludibacteraceae bacterium]|nr:ABC transporter ATP-binding protein [Paludibacteraceae bacterium]
MANAIEFEHVSKQYRLGLVSTKTLSHDIRRFWITNVLGKEDPYLKIGETNDRSTKGTSDYVWALKDIHFNVEQGDVVGIIGKNGAGKSTLLKLLSRVTGPTTGTIRAHGRIGSLLEVGTGFHGEMTGRENIFMNGAILGMTRREIQSKLDEIIDFSGCERYIDTPVKRYSSGMTVRLGFAVAAFLEPEILVVDEVLAVGDAEFQKKAIGKMQDISSGGGRTVLFVSHNMASVRALCKRGVLLENGMVKYMGDINNTIDVYLSNNIKTDELVPIGQTTDRIGSGEAKFTDLQILVNGKDAQTQISINTPVTFRFSVHSTKDMPKVEIRYGVVNHLGVQVFSTNTRFAVKDNVSLHKGDNIFEVEYPNFPLNIGRYRMYIEVWEDENDKLFDAVPNALFFDMVEADIYGTGKFYMQTDEPMALPEKWKIKE